MCACVCELRWNEGLVVRQWSEVWDDDVASLTDSAACKGTWVSHTSLSSSLPASSVLNLTNGRSQRWLPL